jgi:hypothetical protein
LIVPGSHGALALAALLPLLAHAQWSPQLEAGLAHETNFSRAQHERDRIADTALTLDASAKRALPLAADLSVGAHARLAQYLHSGGASFASAGLSAAWRRKLALGLTAP